MSTKNKNKDIQYILTTKNFFSEGICGRVSHACGFIQGCISNNATIELVAEKNANIFIDKLDSNLSITSPSKINHLNLFIYSFKSASKRNCIVIRWRPIVPYIYLFILFRNTNCWLEVNSITGLNSKSKTIRFFVNLSIKLTSKLFNVITVSENSLKKIEEISPIKRKKAIIPNGFQTDYFENSKANFIESSPCNLVYFGKKQDYYDWDMFYSCILNLIEQKKISGAEIFGFNDSIKHKGINFHGPFIQKDITSIINKIENPILILHASDSEIARSGSPMKLFEYAALGLPVVISSSLKEQAKKFIDFNFYSAGEKSNFIETVSKVSENYDAFKKRAKFSKKTANLHYSWTAVLKPWLDDNKIVSKSTHKENNKI